MLSMIVEEEDDKNISRDHDNNNITSSIESLNNTSDKKRSRAIDFSSSTKKMNNCVSTENNTNSNVNIAGYTTNPDD